MDFGSDLTKSTPSPTQIGTSHGGLRDFGSELTKNTPTPIQIGTLHEVLRDSEGSWFVELIAVCPADTVSLLHYTQINFVTFGTMITGNKFQN